MAPPKIISVEFTIPHNDIEQIAFGSERSLLDADIVLFSPSMNSFLISAGTYQGLPHVGGEAARRLRNALDHWKSEIFIAIESGKTVFVMLPEYVEAYADTGTEARSGTGRSMKTMNHVSTVNNFSSIPAQLTSVTPKGGKRIKPAKELGAISGYWAEFEHLSEYKVYFESEKVKPLLVTWSGNRTVGFVGSKAGTLVGLPFVDFEIEAHFEEKDDDWQWTKEAIALGHRFVHHIVGMDKAFRSSSERTPAPSWARTTNYKLNIETTLEAEIEALDDKIDGLGRTRSGKLAKLEEHGILRGLLFEKGKPLEEAVRVALEILGFDVSQFDDGVDEFDAIFVDENNRYLGEVEGRDKASVDITKIRQLAQNLEADFALPNVDKYAFGVLFGNAHRLIAPDGRGDFFTAKCLMSAARSKIALVRTPDLFAVAKYLRDTSDVQFAKKCREAIPAHGGKIVEFPKIPPSTTS